MRTIHSDESRLVAVVTKFLSPTIGFLLASVCPSAYAAEDPFLNAQVDSGSYVFLKALFALALWGAGIFIVARLVNNLIKARWPKLARSLSITKPVAANGHSTPKPVVATVLSVLAWLELSAGFLGSLAFWPSPTYGGYGVRETAFTSVVCFISGIISWALFLAASEVLKYLARIANSMEKQGDGLGGSIG